MENDRDDRQKILVALLAGRETERERESYIVLHKYGESTRMREGGRKGVARGSVQPLVVF